MAKMVRMVKTDIVLQKIISILFLGLIFFLPLIFWIPNSEVFELPKMLFVYLMTALITAVWAMRMILAGRIIWRRTPLDIPILLFLLSQIVSTIYSIDPHISWFGWYGRFNGGLWSTISYTLLYYALVNNLRNKKQETGNNEKWSLLLASCSLFLFAILVSSAIVSLYALFQHFGIDKDFWVQDVMNRVFSTQGQPNWLAGYIVMIMPLAFVITSSKLKNQKSKLLSYGILLVLFLSLLFTKSRSGLLGFAVADTAFWGLVFTKFTKARPCFARPGLNWIIIHLGMLLLILTTNNPARDFLKNSVLQPSSFSPQPSALSPTKSEFGGTESGDIRKIVWNGAAELVKQRPFFGFGPETFGLTYWQVRPKEANLTSEWNFLYNKAHNEWLNLAANTGLFGLGSHLLLLGWFSVWVLKGLVRQLADQALLNYAILAALLGLEAVNFFGFSTVTTETYRYLFMGLVVGFATKGKILKGDSFIKLRWWQYFLLTTIAVSIFWAISGIFNQFQADLKYNLGRQFYSARYISESLESLSQAVNLSPNEPVFRNELAEILSVAAVSVWGSGDETRAVEIKNNAVENFKIVSRQSKFNLTFVRTRAQMEFLMREIDPDLTDEALKLSKQAIDLSPTDPRGYYLLGRMHAELNDKSTAENLYRRALELKPDYEEAIKILNSEY